MEKCRWIESDAANRLRRLAVVSVKPEEEHEYEHEDEFDDDDEGIDEEIEEAPPPVTPRTYIDRWRRTGHLRTPSPRSQATRGVTSPFAGPIGDASAMADVPVTRDPRLLQDALDVALSCSPSEAYGVLFALSESECDSVSALQWMPIVAAVQAHQTLTSAPLVDPLLDEQFSPDSERPQLYQHQWTSLLARLPHLGPAIIACVLPHILTIDAFALSEPSIALLKQLRVPHQEGCYTPETLFRVLCPASRVGGGGEQEACSNSMLPAHLQAMDMLL